MRTTELKVRVPTEMAEAVRTLSKARGQSMNDYVKRAIRSQLVAEATHMEAGGLLSLIVQGTEPVVRSANFAAVHAAAVVALLREVLQERYTEKGMPEALARERVEVLVESVMGEAVETFENPKILHQFSWIERPAEDGDLPDWLKDTDT